MDDYLGSDLIFLISQPRGGSTLLQSILGGNRLVHTVSEPWIMLHPIYALKSDGIATEYDADFARMALEDFLHELPEGEEVYINGIRTMAQKLYSAALYGTGKTRFLDKTNGYFYVIPELHRIFPQARFVLLLRNPLSVLNSILNTWLENCYDLLYQYRDDLLKAPRRIEAGIRLLGNTTVVVHYEQLVSNPESVVSDMCAKLHLPYSEEMLNYGGSVLMTGRAGDRWGLPNHATPVTSSLEKWRKSLRSPQHVHFMQSYLEQLGPELVDRLGYSYSDLYQEVLDHKRHRVVIPWNLAIKRPEERTVFERFQRKTIYRRRVLQKFKKLNRLLDDNLDHLQNSGPLKDQGERNPVRHAEGTTSSR